MLAKPVKEDNKYFSQQSLLALWGAREYLFHVHDRHLSVFPFSKFQELDFTILSAGFRLARGGVRQRGLIAASLSAGSGWGGRRRGSIRLPSTFVRAVLHGKTEFGPSS